MTTPEFDAAYDEYIQSEAKAFTANGFTPPCVDRTRLLQEMDKAMAMGVRKMMNTRDLEFRVKFVSSSVIIINSWAEGRYMSGLELLIPDRVAYFWKDVVEKYKDKFSWKAQADSYSSVSEVVLKYLDDPFANARPSPLQMIECSCFDGAVVTFTRLEDVVVRACETLWYDKKEAKEANAPPQTEGEKTFARLLLEPRWGNQTVWQHTMDFLRRISDGDAMTTAERTSFSDYLMHEFTRIKDRYKDEERDKANAANASDAGATGTTEASLGGAEASINARIGPVPSIATADLLGRINQSQDLNTADKLTIASAVASMEIKRQRDEFERRMRASLEERSAKAGRFE